MEYVVLQVILKEKFLGTGSGNITELENVINTQAKKGYRLHTISTTSSGSKGLMGGDRIQATLVFEKLTTDNLTHNIQLSNTDELLKYKKLLDDGIISQEKFDVKKKELLNL